MLTEQHRKEALGRAYVRAIAAKAGANVTIPEHDYGFDLTMSQVAERTRSDGTKRYADFNDFKVQLKCSVDVQIDQQYVVFDLEADAYNDLAGVPNTPRILVLLHLPRLESEQIDHAAEQLVLKKCAYWLSLRGEQFTPNGSTKRIKIPLTQRFTAEVINEIFGRIRSGDMP